MSKKIEHKIIEDTEYKRCGRCEKLQTLDCFHKHCVKYDGLRSECKSCRKQDSIKDREKKKIYNKQYQISNKEQIREQQKQYRFDSAKEIKERKHQFYLKNAEYIKQYVKQWGLDNPEYQKQYKIEHAEEIKRWYNNNKGKINSYASKYRAMKLDATPPDADKKKIQAYYTLREKMSVNGMVYHVDHIQPLNKGGLNHEDNLQVLEASLNLEKSDKWPLSAEEKIRYTGFRI